MCAHFIFKILIFPNEYNFELNQLTKIKVCQIDNVFISTTFEYKNIHERTVLDQAMSVMMNNM